VFARALRSMAPTMTSIPGLLPADSWKRNHRRILARFACRFPAYPAGDALIGEMFDHRSGKPSAIAWMRGCNDHPMTSTETSANWHHTKAPFRRSRAASKGSVRLHPCMCAHHAASSEGLAAFGLRPYELLRCGTARSFQYSSQHVVAATKCVQV
jgi:hypothetical protein